MLKLKDVARKLTIKHAQNPNFPPTMPSAPGNYTNVEIPKAPKVPVEFASPETMPISEFTTKNPSQKDDFIEEIPSTIGPKHLDALPNWKNNLINSIDLMYYANVYTGIYAAKIMKRVKDATSEHEVADIKRQMQQELNKAESHAVSYLHKIKKIRANLDK